MIKSVLFLSLFIILFVGVSAVFAAPQPVTGWAWIGADNCDILPCASQTNPLGWVSFNCSSDPAGCLSPAGAWGVTIDYATGDLAGYAWMGGGASTGPTDQFSWLDFQSNALPSFIPTPVADLIAARYDSGSGKIVGMAPIVAGATIISWVHFCSACAAPAYSVVLNSTTGSTHYAWAGNSTDTDFTGLGWIDFRQVVFPTPPPAVTFSLAAFQYCLGVSAQEKFSWTTNIILPNTQTSFDVQIGTVGSGAANVFDSGQVSSGNASYITPTGILIYSASYDWRMQVKDSTQWSDWTAWTAFSTGGHSLLPSFTYLPSSPSANEVVTFTQNTTLSGGVPAPITYSWTFQDAVPPGPVSGSPVTTIFQNATPSSKSVTLTVNEGDTPVTHPACSLTSGVNVSLPLPIFKEIIPR